QDTQQRAWLLQFASDKAQEWQMKRAEAESIATKLGTPIRQTYADGVTIELQRFEAGMPIYYMTHNLSAARTISTNKVWPSGGYGFSLTGSTDTLGIWDAGRVRLEHQEFATNRVTQVDGATTNNDHATHVAGTMVATGVVASAKGMAYQARLRAWDWNNDESEMANSAAAGLRVSNHSYGIPTGWRYNYFNDNRWAWFGDTTISNTEDYNFGFYNWLARNWDDIARNAPHYLIVKSAGNERLEGPASQPVQHWVQISGQWVLRTITRNRDGAPNGYDCLSYYSVAKNVLTIGAVNDIPGGYNQPSDVGMSSFSSWGPTDDGRIKPDIVANGVDLYSPIASSNTAYGTYSGTSMASPNVSGSIGLLLQHHKNLYGDNPLRASTLKALIIHTSDEAGTNQGPDYQFGWGLMNTLKAVQVIKANHERGGSHVYELVLQQGSTIEMQIRASGTEPLRATICWTDPAGTPPSPSLNPTTRMLVNDLDVRLIRFDATTFSPYVLNPSNPSAAPTTGDNIRDNVEQVHIQSPQAGLYTVRISHKGTLSGGSQAVSFVITGNTDILVRVDQKLEDNITSVDSIGRWEGGPIFKKYLAPKTFSFAEGAAEVLRGTDILHSSQKYNRWNKDMNVVNHRSFTIQIGEWSIISQLKSTHTGITIRNELIDAPSLNGGSIEFKDPWLVDVTDSRFYEAPYGYRNLGMNAPFKQESSPFYPTTASKYKGVFLNQDPALTPAYYSVRVPQTQTIGNFQCSFVGWEATGAQLVQVGSNPTGYDQKAVIFTSANAIVKARYRATSASITTTLGAGWHMVSIPDTVSNFHRSVVYSNSPDVFAYNAQSGVYVKKDTLKIGVGYWVKFSSTQDITYTGKPIFKDSLTVYNGWNMIGSISAPFPVSKLKSSPNNIISSDVFAYRGSYVPIDTIKPGYGYWIKVNQNGKLIFDLTTSSYTAPVVNSPVPPNPPCEEPPTPTLSGTTVLHNNMRFPHLTWTSSGSGITYRLYLYMCYTGFEDCYRENSAVCMYTGPNLSFTDYYIEVGHKLSTRRAYYFVVAENACNETSGNSNKISYAVGTTGDFKQVWDSNVEENNILPLNTELLDCYPNPFNPQTTIRYTLAEPAHVKLVVLNTLGQEVATLVDEMQEAGFKSVRFNASELPSGVYFYQIDAGNPSSRSGRWFRDMKKLLLVK
ncbi:MAG: S8 family serine peptidase, partial [Bacteroidota bacterium]|nr:S8 family serine peptidase [Bacteroidota bacterium]